MPRNRIRKTSKGTLPKEVMEQAVKHVIDDNRSICSISKEKGISKTTLLRYIKKYKASHTPVSFEPNYANRQVFSREEEEMLENYILDAARMHHGLTLKMTRKLAYEFAVMNKKNMPASWNKNTMAGEDWLYHFRHRHPKMSLRQPEATSLSRATSFNKHNISIFFNNLKDLYSRFVFEPQDIYNIDETGLTTVHNPSKILAEKGAKQIGRVTSAERGQLVTMCLGVNALGNAIPPFFIFPRVHFKNHMLHGAPEGSGGSASTSGWMTCEIFFMYMEHFIKYAKCSKEKPTLILLDNHESHVSIPVLNLAKEHGIHILTFHPHTSHKIQPLDRTVFGPFKEYYNRASDSWMMQNPGKPMTIYNICSLVGIAYPQALSMKNIQSGFRVTGIWPFNADVFDDAEFQSSYVTDKIVTSVQHEPAQNDLDELEVEDLPSVQVNKPTQNDQKELEDGLSPDLPLPSTSKSLAIIHTPEEIRPFPKSSVRKSNFKRRKGASRILTDTPVKCILEEEAKQREEKKLKQKNAALLRAKRKMEKELILVHKRDQQKNSKGRKKRQTVISDSSSDSNIFIYSDSEMSIYSDTESIIEPNTNFYAEGKVGDYVLVKFLTKKTTIHYIGLVLERVDESCVLIRFMRRKSNQDNIFIFPENVDESLINIEDIVMILPDHSLPQESSRLSVVQKSFAISFANFNVR